MIDSKKEIVILGGGIVGMAAALIAANKYPNAKISIIANEFKGNFSKGGLKYLHATPGMWRFMDDLSVSKIIGERKINGACLIESGGGYKVVSYPDYFWFNKGTKYESQIWDIQQEFWAKTRGNDKFSSTCMNNPHVYKNNTFIELNPVHLLNIMLDYIERNENIMLYKQQITLSSLRELFADVLKDEIDVIYTIPVSLLYQLVMNRPFSSKAAMLKIFKMEISGVGRHGWWDYLYVPQTEFLFHRISVTGRNLYGDGDVKDLYLDIETNSDVADGYVIKKQFDELNQELFGFREPTYCMNYLIEIPGHLITSKADDFELFKQYLPENLFLVGRYAMWDSRMTFDRAVNALYSIFG